MKPASNSLDVSIKHWSSVQLQFSLDSALVRPTSVHFVAVTGGDDKLIFGNSHFSQG